jgi:hypothetical protein
MVRRSAETNRPRRAGGRRGRVWFIESRVKPHPLVVASQSLSLDES